MKTKGSNDFSPPQPPLAKGGYRGGVAFLWDESFLWGLMAYRALEANRLPFGLIRSDDIKRGCLQDYKALFVPGGWASNKIKTLGIAGAAAVKEFVSNGGYYLGFCGGAGLATLDGIGLLNVKRKPTRERVPSFSGRIRLNISEHLIWKGLTENSEKAKPPFTNGGLGGINDSKPVFHAWWPSQFLIEDKNIKILARYGDALLDSFSSDLNVGDVEANSSWPELERIYKINLNPHRLLNNPAIVEGKYGKGRVVLSLIHFDTPDDLNGAAVLKNLWEYLTGQKPEAKKHKIQNKEPQTLTVLSELENSVAGLISLGQRNFLWFWRNPMLLQWRRGVRGLEYCTLYIMVKEIAEIIEGTADYLKYHKMLVSIKESLIPFVERAKYLLMLERHALQNGHITYEKCDNPEIQKIRTELFSNSKSYGGLFKELIDKVDSLLYILLKQNG